VLIIFLLYSDLHEPIIFIFKLFFFLGQVSFFKITYSRRDHYIFRTWSIFLTNIVFYPSVGAEFVVDLDGSMFLHTPSVRAACIYGVYMILILEA
jgi:hypothetical protein